ncbi:MAG: serine hydroxymethyltransferase [Terriglobales bacterium]
MSRPLYEVDPEISNAIDNEVRRQHEGLELIASENFVSEAVLEAAGSVFTNKYAEGYPGKRYYGGCEFTDVVENLARERVKKLFGAEHANVQPHSGSQANQAAYAAVLQPGDTILGLNLAHGGHLTHGHPLNFSGKTYKIVPYGVTRETETIDYDDLEKIAMAERPKLIIGGGSAYPRIIDFARMRQIADKVGAIYLVDMAHFAGLVAGGAHPSPVPHAQIVTSTTHKTLRGPRAGMILSKQEFAAPIEKTVFPGMQGGPLVHIIAAKAVCFFEAAQPSFRDYARQIVANAKVMAETLAADGYRIVSGGTDTHLMLVDVFAKGMLGSEAEKALGEAGITVNKNAIPFDTNPPMKPSGIRIGSPAVTTRGMKEAEMRQISHWIAEALDHRTDAAVLAKIRKQVLGMAEEFPLYAERRARAQAEARA